MKTTNYFAFVVAILLLSQCDERVASTNSEAANTIFTKTVGGPISAELAAQWVSRKQSHSSGREENFSVSAEQLQTLLSQTDNKLGVTLHHAESPDGEHHLIVAPVKSDLQSWTNGPVLDAVSNELVDATLAKSWVTTFKGKNPDGPWSHFYGMDLFDEITTMSGFSRIDFVAGEDEQGQSPMLIFAWSASPTGNGKSKEESSVYDRGYVCPTVCPTLED